MLRPLGVQPIERRIVRLANNDRVELDLGQAWLRVDGKERATVVIFGDDDAMPLLGAVTLEELGLGVDPVNRRLIEVEGYLLERTLAPSGTCEKAVAARPAPNRRLRGGLASGRCLI